MEAVRAFNNELSSLYESRPPVSRAKMANVTKCAIKAIKFYKHVVQSVEKFIQKCKPEYKVPGLYVIDSVVRQSRHQFGSKDLFAPRFTKNIITTFQNLFKCPGDERSKIVRVLNLWQKNEVFPSEIIQPLLDMAADPTKPSTLAAAQAAVDRIVAASGKASGSRPNQQHQQQPAGDSAGANNQQDSSLSQSAAESMLATQNDMLNTVTQLLQQTDSSNQSLSAQQQQLQQLQLLQQQLIQQTQLMQQPSGTGPLIDNNLLAQIQTLTNQLLSKSEPKSGGGFNTKLLDFDYGESDDEDDHNQSQNDTSSNVQTILNDSSLMQQIHQMSQTIQKTEQLKTELDEQEERRRVLEQQQVEFDQQISQSVMNQVQQPPPPTYGGPPPPPPHGGPPHMHGGPPPPHGGPPPTHGGPPPPQGPGDMPVGMTGGYAPEEGEYEEDPVDEDFRDHQQLRDRDDRRDRDRRRRSRDRTRSRTPKRRRRSRSRSRDRRRRSRSKDRRRRSRSRDKRSRSKEKQREKERERRKKCLPAIRGNFVTICTTTIWIGHLNKFTSEEELRAQLEHYGPVDNINMVPPRGCAYVVMTNRKDAAKAIDRLKGYKLNGSALKTAWAQSSGIRESEFKDSWDLDEGAIYIPWDSVPPSLLSFLEGGIIDGDSLPEHLKNIPTEKGEQAEAAATTSVPQMMPGQQNQQAMPGQQQQMLGMLPTQTNLPPPMGGMMPNMMMGMQRPLLPGMPSQSMALTPGTPQQPMLPGAAGARGQVPSLPGVRPPTAPVSMNPMSMANTAANTLSQNIQNIMANTPQGMLPTPGARPGFPPGTPPRFGFNPNLPPPGFRLPPPGFGGPMPPMMPPGMRLNAPSEPPKPDDDKPNTDRPKQPEMMWPPDSNEKDEDMEEDSEEDTGGSNIKSDSNDLFSGNNFGGKPNMPSGPPDSPMMRMMGPRPPGGFSPMNQPWNNRMSGPPRPGMSPMGMRPQMGGNNNQDNFSNQRRPLLGMGPGPGQMFMGNRGPLMGDSRPPLMGNRPGMPMGPGFQRFPPGGMGGPNSNTRGPVPLLDLPLKPMGGFDRRSDDGKDEMNDEDQTNEDKENVDESEKKEAADESEDPQNVYPFNTWQTVSRNEERRKDSDRNYDDRSDDRDRRNDDRGWDRGRDRYNRDRDRDYDRRDRRDSRDRDRHRDRDRGRDRDNERDWRRRDDRDRRDRDSSRRDNDRDRPRSSRWSNVEEDNQKKESDQGNEPESENNAAEKSDSVVADSSTTTPQKNVTEDTDTSVVESVTEPPPVLESVTEPPPVLEGVEETPVDKENDAGVETNIEPENKENNEVVDGGNIDRINSTGFSDTNAVADTNGEVAAEKDNIETNTSTELNGPTSVETTDIVQSKLDVIKQAESVSEDAVQSDKKQSDVDESAELEEGEIAS